MSDGGNQGLFASAWEALKGLAGAGKKPPPSEQKCKKPKHWVAARLRYKDDKTDVAAADCIIYEGSSVLNPGPLAAGKLESRNLDGGSYQVSFPNIHADEWEAE